MRYSVPATIPIQVRRDGAEPLHRQIAADIASAVRRGVLPAGSRLPSTRTLAAHLGVSRGVTAEAYAELLSRGFLRGARGSGTYVAGTPEPPSARVVHRPPAAQLPVAAWRTAWRHATFRPPPVGPLPPLGLPGLRAAVAAYVRQCRGLPLDGHEVVVTTGAPAGVRAVLAALARPVAVADGLPAVFVRAAGVQGPPWAVPSDGEGVCVDRIPSRCGSLLLAPDRPSLSAARRSALLEWAGRLVTVVAPGPLSPAASRLPRLWNADTVLVGDLCTVLTPLVGVGYAVVPAALAPELARQLAEQAGQPPYVSQAAVERLLRDGTVARLAYNRATTSPQHAAPTQRT
jgi:GntR family transcriptional regulator/MocR family aminotransferase